jgi:hypothetical protein
MSRLDDLPPDQRAALALLLSQGKDYAEVAALLQIGERAVHDRAHAALAVLAPRQARGLTPERREEIGDYLLGQSSAAGERLRTRSMLEDSTASQAWARALASELAPLATAPLPEIPDDTRPSGDGVRARDAGGSAPRTAPVAVDADAGRDAARSLRAPSTQSRPAARTTAQLPSSRVGGAILLAVIAGVVVAVVLLTSGGGSHHATTTRSASATGTSTTPRASETRRLALSAPSGSASKAIGVAAVLQEGSTYAFYLAAERLAPSNGFFYAVWLYNSPTSYEPLSRSPPVKSDGRLQGGALLPGDAYKYHQMVVTKETGERPTQPGAIVLQGAFGLR